MHLAIRSCQGLGLLFIILGLFGVVGLAAAHTRAGIVGSLTVILFFGLPGVMYVITAIYMRRRQPWAVIVGLVVASLDGLFALLALLGSLMNVTRSPVLAIIALLWVLAMGQLIYQLAKSPVAMRADAQYQPRGFEVIPMAVQVEEEKSSDV
jgi:hypothetical protein